MTRRPPRPCIQTSAFALAFLAGALAAGAAFAQGAPPHAANPPAVTPRPPAAAPAGVLDPFAHSIPPAGRPKCAAFRRVRTETDALQARSHGALPAAQRRRLGAELRHVRGMDPKGVTAAACGVAL